MNELLKPKPEMPHTVPSPEAPRGATNPEGNGAIVRPEENFPILEPQDGCPRTAYSGRLRTVRSWHGCFTDRSQLLDNRRSKDNPKALDFKHKITKESLWIEDVYNPSWVNDMLKGNEPGSEGMHGAKASTEDRGLMESVNNCKASVRTPVQVNASEAQEDRGLVEGVTNCKASFRTRVLIRASKEQELRLNRDREMLSLEEALTSLEQIPQLPSVKKFIYILQKCRKEKNVAYAKLFHAYMCKSGLEAHKSLGNYLVPMLVECGSMCDALQVFQRLVDPNEYSWTSLITGYTECGESQNALNLYQKMQEDCVHPSKYTFVALLKACARLKDVESGRGIHAEIAKQELERDPFVGSTLVDMYAKCGLLAKARKVFDKLSARDVVTWNALIAGYAQYGHGEEALTCLEHMQQEGISPDAVTFVCSLKACGNIGAIDKGRDIHAKIASEGLERDLFVGNTLVDMYSKSGLLEKAQELFGKLPVRDVVSWNALLAGYAEHGFGEQALSCFKRMQLEGVSPDALTFVCILKACGKIGSIDRGREVHAEIATWELETDPFVGNTLVDMYVKCGSLARAQEAFDKLSFRDVVSWTALMTGYAEHGLGEEALDCFEQMQSDCVSPNAVTFISSLKACGSVGAIDKGQEIHAEIARKGLERDSLVGSTLVDMYSKCGLLAKAQEAFDKLAVRNIVSWTALLAGYAEHGLGEEALDCFRQMQLEGVPRDAVTFVWSLKACASAGTIDEGQELYSEIARKGLERDCFVGSNLVDMYAKCGSLAEAREVFDKLPVRDVVSWTALITGYAQLGESETVFLMLDKMREEGIKPSGVTFLIVLTVCTHAGLVNKGQKYFDAMCKDYNIIPTIEHHTSMVDLLSRSGQLDQAVVMVEEMPFQPDLVVWHIVLGACRRWGNVELARRAFEHAVQLDKKEATAYVLMSSIYADAQMHEDEKKVETMREKQAAWMKPGQSWTEVDGIVHAFVLGDTSHSQSKDIHAKLEDLSLKMQNKGFVPDLSFGSLDVSNGTNKEGFCGHSEKLAIAFVLVNTPKGTSIRVVKNSVICKDCHAATRIISKIEQRTILVRDAKCDHVFKEGKCTCEVYG